MPSTTLDRNQPERDREREGGMEEGRKKEGEREGRMERKVWMIRFCGV
jgi:hypothetical protein